MFLKWLNFVFGLVYLVAFLFDVFTFHGVSTFYTQAFSVGYGLSALKNNGSPVIPLWVAALINSMTLVLNRTLWVNSIVVVLQWVQFTIALTSFLVASKNSILGGETIDRFNMKVELLVLFLFDLFVETPTLGLLIYVILRVQRSVYPLDISILIATLIYTGLNADWINLALGLLMVIYENIRYNGYGNRIFPK